MDIPATAASIMAAAQDQRLDFRTIKTIIQGITAGKRGRGRPARTWERDIEEWARTNIGETTRMAERRDLWCTVIDVTAAQP